jgi:hypothetical protein
VITAELFNIFSLFHTKEDSVHLEFSHKTTLVSSDSLLFHHITTQLLTVLDSHHTIVHQPFTVFPDHHAIALISSSKNTDSVV